MRHEHEQPQSPAGHTPGSTPGPGSAHGPRRTGGLVAPDAAPPPVHDALLGVRRAFLAVASVVLAVAIAARLLDAPRAAIVALLILSAAAACYGLSWPRRVERTVPTHPTTTVCAHSTVRFGFVTVVEVEGSRPSSGVWCWGRSTWVAETVHIHASKQGPLVFSAPHRTLVAISPPLWRRAATPTRRVGRSLGEDRRRRGR